MTGHPQLLTEGLSTLSEAGVDIPAEAADRLLAFVELIQKWNRVHNLTAIRESDKIVSHHLLDSLAVLSALTLSAGERVLDVGSGAGLPGIPLAIARPAVQFTLLDSNAKKAAFMVQARMELRLDNVVVVSSRVEDFRAERAFDLIISRALSELSDFARLTQHLLAPGGELVAMKGVVPHEELAALPPDLQVSVAPLRVPGLDANRCLVRLRRIG